MNVIITGASKGIGFQIARSFVLAGDNKLGLTARSSVSCEQLKQENTSPGPEIISYPFDLDRLIEYPRKLAERIYHDFDHVDILINNAGFLVNKPFMELQAEDYTKSYRINFLAPALLIRELVPLLSKSSIRHIVNISSMGGYQGSKKFTGLAAYSSSKAALSNLTESLAVELKDMDIHVNCLALGAVQTEMLSQAFPNIKAPVSPDEMGKFIYHFAIEAGKVMNGKVIPVSLSIP
ncbi:MAG TPA: SDR family oxidoreductase [Bacteroidetes bacterium]|nr:SDR family oxidoreductase [Bacteroidota bacterium]